MSQKEFTVFVIENGPTEYWHQYCSGLLLKNRKSDRVAVVAGDAVVFHDDQFTYENYKEAAKVLASEEYNGTDPEGGRTTDYLDLVLAGLALFRPKIHLKYIRTLVVLTAQLPTEETSSSKLDEASELINAHGIKVVFGVDDYAHVSKQRGFERWRQVVASWNGASIFAAHELHQTIHSAPLRKVAPRVSFTGPLRFGQDVENPGLQSPISITVSVYPAIKVEKPLGGHEYVVSDKVDAVKRHTVHYIKKYAQKEKPNDDENEIENEIDDDDSHEFEKVVISSSESVPGFKYSKRDVIAVSKDLAHMAQLPSNAGIDCLGFARRHHLAYVYLIDETHYVIPPADSSAVNSVSFSSLVRAMIDMDGVAIVRYVPSTDADIQVCVMIPQLFEQSPGKYVHGFVLGRLAFKEDEKIGRFPYLTKKEGEVKEEEEEEEEDDENNDNETVGPKPREYPSDEINSLMESFINAHDLDNDNKSPGYVTANQKVNLLESEALQFPKSLPQDTDTNLLASSPAIHKNWYYLHRIISKSLSKESLPSFLKEDKFVEKYLVDQESTNLFNKINILTGNTSGSAQWLQKLGNPSQTSKLVEKLGVEYLKRSPQEGKRRMSDSTYSEFFKKERKEDNEKFDEFFDIQDIIG